MSALKPNQLATLRAIPQFDGGQATAAHTGAMTGRTLPSERAILRNLHLDGYVRPLLASKSKLHPFYVLTDKGRKALTEDQQP